MEIGIFTFWASKDNYGQTLQSFALQHFLNMQNGIQAEVIRYYAFKKSVRSKIKSLIKKVVLCAFPFIARETVEACKKIRQRDFKSFKQRNIPYSSKILYGKDALNKCCRKYDVLIAGSDQIWSMMLDNPMNSVYYLDFGTKVQKRISYAASFGLHSYPSILKDELRKQLSRFDFISVRENDGIEICRECGVDAVQVLDPTLLLEKSVYRQFLLKKRTIPYTFMYVLNINDSNDINWTELRKNIKTSRIIGTNGSGYTKSQIILDGVEYENSTIEQWLSNIAYAELVITTSFHGVVFSILFEKNFVYIPLKGKYSQSNNRAVNLLHQLSLEYRALNNERRFVDILNDNINYTLINQKLNVLKKKSINFLTCSLQSK